MTTVVHLVRHGSHDRLGKVLCGRMEGVTLSLQGVAQARSAAALLAERDIAAVYTSPQERTRQTAAEIAGALGLPFLVDDGLAEIDFGAWSGRAFDDLAGDPAWDAWNNERDSARPPGGETMAEVQGRVSAFIDRARQSHPDEAVVAVSHCDVIKAALLQVLDLPLRAYDRLNVDPGSISVVISGSWGSKVHSINEVAA